MVIFTAITQSVRSSERKGAGPDVFLAGAAAGIASSMLVRLFFKAAARKGTSDPATHEGGEDPAGERLSTQVEAIISSRAVATAFQPIRHLATGKVTGVEALTRFDGVPVRSPQAWFADATSAGCVRELEFLALESAVEAAAALPAHLYVSVNVSPQACLDPRMDAILQNSSLAADRIVLELTEHTPVTDYEPLCAALGRARSLGLRIAVDDAGAGFASMRHILHVRPDVIKLDRDLVSEIDGNQAKMALGAAMVTFATGIGADLVAEGIETEEELAAVRDLGVTAGQGYLLGRPSVEPEQWRTWREP
ncbi:EAL domain-containing protein [Paenarthrobacter sp. NPDC057355]|uniref:EAL domain-containing protein n=1 Tax=Paenarthrobacter sp. NPDC057355 TaxID=3346105 RepID=UPI00363A126D